MTPSQAVVRRFLCSAILLIGAILIAMMFINNMMNPKRKIDVTQFWTYVENNQLEGTLYLKSDSIEGTTAPEVMIKKDEPSTFYVDYRNANSVDFTKEVTDALKKSGSTVKVEQVVPNWLTSVLPSLLLPIPLFILLWVFLFKKMGAGGGGGMFGSFGRSRHRMMTKEQSKITFNDVAGIDDAKEGSRRDCRVPQKPRKNSAGLAAECRVAFCS